MCYGLGAHKEKGVSLVTRKAAIHTHNKLIFKVTLKIMRMHQESSIGKVFKNSNK